MAMVDLREEVAGDTAILATKWNAGVLRWDQDVVTKAVRSLVARGHVHIRLDVAEVPELDSDRLGEMVQCMSLAARAGGEFKLIHLNERIRSFLADAGLLALLGDEGAGGPGRKRDQGA